MTDNTNNNNNDKELTLHLTLAGNQSAPRIPLKISSSSETVFLPSELRKKVSEATHIPLPSLRLIYRGKLISDKDDSKCKSAITEYKLEDGSVLHCMGKPTTTTSAAAASSSTTTTSDQQQQQNQASSAAAAASGSTVSVQQPSTASMASGSAPTATTSGDPLKDALQTLRLSSNSPAEYKTAVTTLGKILTNIVNNPNEEKYRKVKKQNAAFQRRLGGLTGGDAAMIAAGFVTTRDNDDDEEIYIMHASAEAWPKLMAAKATVEAAVHEAETSASSRPTMPTTPGFGAGGTADGMPGFGGLPAAGAALNPAMHNAMASMLSDPDAMRSLMQNPMFQQMMRNDPRMANNPMMQRTMEELANNPEAANRLSEMMRDPNMQRMMQDPEMMRRMQDPNTMNMIQGMMQDPNAMRMMQEMQQLQAGSFGGGGMMPPSFGAPPPAGAAGGVGGTTGQQQQQQQQPGNNASSNNAQSGGGGTTGNNNNQGQSDQDMTEDEMIAEAIRRSLQDS